MNDRGWVRPPAVAGFFYPADPRRLARDVDGYVSGVVAPTVTPKAVIVPHAGYRYSGAVAGRGFARLSPVAESIERVVVVGPAHKVPVAGVAVSSATAFATPLGLVTIDEELRDKVLAHDACHVDDEAHRLEHSLEVQLPFLQRLLGSFTFLPLVAGRSDADTVADVLETAWGGPETVVVVSTDLSHYHDHATAEVLDRRTAELILARDHQALRGRDACGAVPLRGVLEVARRRDLHVALLDLRTSGDTAGPRDRVVGYGAFAVA